MKSFFAWRGDVMRVGTIILHATEYFWLCEDGEIFSDSAARTRHFEGYLVIEP